MSKNKERDELIQKKLDELTERKEKLEKKLEKCSKDYKTNLNLKDENGNLVVNLRIVNDVEILTDKRAFIDIIGVDFSISLISLT